MKFGKELKDCAIPGWEEYYVSFKRLKRVIKKIVVQAKERKSREHEEKSPLSDSDSSSDDENSSGGAAPSAGDGGAPTLRLPDKQDAELFQWKEEQLKLQELQASHSIPPVSPDLTVLVSSWLADDAKSQFQQLFQEDLTRINQFFHGKLIECQERAEFLGDSENIYYTNNLPVEGNSDEITGENGILRGLANWWNNQNYQQIDGKQENQKHSQQTNSNGVYGATEDIVVPGLTHRHQAAHSAPPTAAPHTITVSQSTQLAARCSAVLDLYRRILQLQSYRDLNRKGFEKILKKYDKYAAENEEEKKRKSFMSLVDHSPFLLEYREDLAILIRKVEEMYLKYSISRQIDLKAAQNLLKAVEKDIEFHNQAENHPSEALSPGAAGSSLLNTKKILSNSSSYFWVLVAILAFLFVMKLPILEEFPRAHSCFSLLVGITVLWITEAVPYFVSALIIPFSVVLLNILVDDQGIPLKAEKASKLAFGSMYSDASILIISSFALSTAFSKSSHDLRVADFIQRKTGSRPLIFLLAYMLLGAFASFFISNIASPVLFTSLLEPHLKDFQRTNQYARSLLLALAFSCNIGGLLSPISSPENSIILGYLEEKFPTHSITVTQWISMSIPFAILAIFFIWGYFCLIFLHSTRENEIPRAIPPLYVEYGPMRKQDYAILGTTFISIILLYSLQYTRYIFGNMATVALIPVLFYFGSGILSKKDLSSFNWQLILLIGGGNVLGFAIQNSKLLNLFSTALLPYIHEAETHWTAIAIIGVVFLVTSLVSRTVAAIILTPIVLSLGSSVHHLHLFVMCVACSINCTMSLPMTSFPNINALLVADDFGRPFLHAIDYIKHGIAVSLLMIVLLGTVGYSFMRLAFDKSIMWENPAEILDNLTGSTGGGSS